jgi:hypothetical protein
MLVYQRVHPYIANELASYLRCLWLSHQMVVIWSWIWSNCCWNFVKLPNQKLSADRQGEERSSLPCRWRGKRPREPLNLVGSGILRGDVMFHPRAWNPNFRIPRPQGLSNWSLWSSSVNSPCQMETSWETGKCGSFPKWYMREPQEMDIITVGTTWSGSWTQTSLDVFSQQIGLIGTVCACLKKF